MRTIRLGDYSTVGLSNIDKKAKDNETPVYLCNFVDVYHNWMISSEIKPFFMQATANENQYRDFVLKKGQVAITKDSETRDDIGIPTYISEDMNDTVLGYHCALITPDGVTIDGSFLNVVLHSPYAQKYFEFNASGSGQRYTLTKEIIEDFPVPYFDIDTQRIIGGLLNTIDEKISLNKSICSDLEALVKEIYDFWFVQFDFPDEQGKPYKSNGGKMVWNKELKREIPAGWEVKPLGKCCSFENGDRSSNYPSGDDFIEKGIPFVAGGSIVDSSIDYTQLRYISETKYQSLRAGKALKWDILLTLRGSLAKCVFSPFEKMAIASALVIVRPNNEVSNEYLYQNLISDYYVKLLTNYDNGSVQGNLSVDTIKSFPFIVPDPKTNAVYSEKASKIYQKMMSLKEENQQMIELRDFLLPMLMNGQIKIGE